MLNMSFKSPFLPDMGNLSETHMAGTGIETLSIPGYHRKLPDTQENL